MKRRIPLFRYLAPLALATLMSCAVNDQVADRQPGQLLVCHDGKSLMVSNAGMFVHQGHGDTLGPCPDAG
jgi:hypothetical protein